MPREGCAKVTTVTSASAWSCGRTVDPTAAECPASGSAAAIGSGVTWGLGCVQELKPVPSSGTVVCVQTIHRFVSQARDGQTAARRPRPSPQRSRRTPPQRFASAIVWLSFSILIS